MKSFKILRHKKNLQKFLDINYPSHLITESSKFFHVNLNFNLEGFAGAGNSCVVENELQD